MIKPLKLSTRDRLKLIRLERGLSLQSFAEKLRISPSYLARMENGQRPVANYIRSILALDDDSTFEWFHLLQSIIEFYNTPRYEKSIKKLRKILNKCFNLEQGA